MVCSDAVGSGDASAGLRPSLLRLAPVCPIDRNFANKRLNRLSPLPGAERSRVSLVPFEIARRLTSKFGVGPPYSNNLCGARQFRFRNNLDADQHATVVPNRTRSSWYSSIPAALVPTQGSSCFDKPFGRGYDHGLVSAIAGLRHVGPCCRKVDGRSEGRAVKTWSSPTMSSHCADEKKYGVAGCGGEAI